MRRRLFTALSVLSGLLLALAAAAWPRTLRIADVLTYMSPSDAAAVIGTGPSCLYFTLGRGRPPFAPAYAYLELPSWRPGWSHESVPWGSSRIYNLSDSTMKLSSDGVITSKSVMLSYLWIPPAHEFLGTGWESKAWTVGPPMYVSPGTVHHTRVVLPLWLVMIACAILPAAWIYKRAIGRRRNREGHCPACGYDLRASKDRCPECGKPHRPMVVDLVIHKAD
jgi:hypothetical protein